MKKRSSFIFFDRLSAARIVIYMENNIFTQAVTLSDVCFVSASDVTIMHLKKKHRHLGRLFLYNQMDLTDEQWTLLEPLIPQIPSRSDSRGRPRRNPREVLDGILWVLRTGAPWKDLPERYPPYRTCHRWHQRWSQEGVFEDILLALAEDLRDRGGLDIREAFIDGTFSPAKKGGLELGGLKGAMGPRSWPLQTALVFLTPSTWTALRRMK